MYLFWSGDDIDVILEQGVEVGHVEIVELGLVGEHQEGGASLGEAPGETDPVLPEDDQDYYQENVAFWGSMPIMLEGVWILGSKGPLAPVTLTGESDKKYFCMQLRFKTSFVLTDAYCK